MINDSLSQLDFRKVFESSPGLYVLLAPDTSFTILAVTDEYLASTMTNREIINGRPFFEIFPDNPNDPTADGSRNLKASLNYVLETRMPHRMDVQKYDIQRPLADGGGFEVRYWSLVNNPVISNDGSVQSIIHSMEDVTQTILEQNLLQQKDLRTRELEDQTVRMGRQLQQNEQSYRLLIEGAKDYAILRLDSAGRILTWNEGGKRIYGYDASEVIGKHYSLLNKLNGGIECAEALHSAAVNGRHESEGWRFRKNGEKFWADIILTVLLDRKGQISGFSKITRDSTERKKAEEQLRELNENLERLVQERTAELKAKEDWTSLAIRSSKVGTWNFTPGVDELFWDVRCREMFGVISDKAVTFESFEGAIHPEDRERVLSRVADITNAGKSGDYINEYRTVGLEDKKLRWLMAQGRSYFDSKGKLEKFTGIVMDMTPQKLIEEELNDAIRSRDEFLSIASHELKTPLSSLSLQLQMLLRNILKNGGTFEVPQVTAGLAVCERQVRRLGVLLDELLDLTRIRLGRMQLIYEEFDLGALATEVVKKAHIEAIIKNSEIEIHTAPAIIGKWDRSRIEQVIMNLITNAMKYGEQRPVAIYISNHGDHAELTVADNGMGIPEGMQKKIFERFERAIGPTNISGLGLGLYISRQIVEAHGGAIRVESQIGKGSTFFIKLPLQPLEVTPVFEMDL